MDIILIKVFPGQMKISASHIPLRPHLILLPLLRSLHCLAFPEPRQASGRTSPLCPCGNCWCFLCPSGHGSSRHPPALRSPVLNLVQGHPEEHIQRLILYTCTSFHSITMKDFNSTLNELYTLTYNMRLPDLPISSLLPSSHVCQSSSWLPVRGPIWGLELPVFCASVPLEQHTWTPCYPAEHDLDLDLNTEIV